MHPANQRASAFCEAYGLRLPILLAPMAGACPPALSIAVAEAGGLGACGALLLTPAEIRKWAAEFRAGSSGGFQINIWIPDPPPVRDPAAEAAVRAFLAGWGPEPPPEAADARLPDFVEQCEALLEAAPAAISSIMGLFPPALVTRAQARGIKWMATATTVAEARRAEAAGADAIIVQGMEAGGHRGAFDAAKAEAQMVGLLALLPAVADAVRVPVIAAG
ncbi:MAG: nitronate monooxygenase, partial [Terriglobales bacterium]